VGWTKQVVIIPTHTHTQMMVGILQISNQLPFFTKIGVFLHARCKKSLLDVKNLPVAFIVGISTIPLDADSERGRGLAPHYVIALPPISLRAHFYLEVGD